MEIKCEAIDKDAQPTLIVRTRTPVQELPNIIGKTYGEIFHYLGEIGEEAAGMPFVAYHNLDMQDLDVEIGVPVSKVLGEKGDIKAGEMAAGKYATCLHVGPYSEIEPAYNALSKWIGDNGFEATGVAYEVYLNDPREVGMENAETRILLPLK
ncbi:MAG: GyrI-like domain-containing protein [Candidatus Hodarchaeota archaeon]